jgi:cold shock protein
VPKPRIVGVVRSWDEEDGSGVIDAPETPGGCFVHHTNIVASGYRTLMPGERVQFTFEKPLGQQDGCDYRSLGVWRDR